MHTLIAAGDLHPLVQDLGVCIVASAVFGVIFERLRIPTIAALLGSGVLVGPIGLQLVQSQGSIETIANLGLTLLLFVIGLEVNPASLLASGRTLLLTGVLQVPLTILLASAAFWCARILGWPLLEGSYAPLYLGAACAFSSTLLVVKLLQERLKLDSVSGRYCVGLLIFQDVWAIIFLALQPSFEEPQITPIFLTFVGIAIVVGLSLVAARWVLPIAFRVVAKVPELVVTVALGWCFGLGLVGVHLQSVVGAIGLEVPISVSMEMCALIAGASLAASPYTHEVVGKVGNLRDFFVTLFFVGLGMSIPVPDSADVVTMAAVLSVLAIALRYLVFLPLLYTTGLDRRHALETATKLAQVSEFCLVIAYLGVRFEHVDQELVSAIIFAFVLTALVTPALFTLSDTLYDRVRPILDALGFQRPKSQPKADDRTRTRVVILGFHRVAAALLHEIAVEHPELLPSIQVVDFNVAVHDQIRSTGVSVTYGDISNAATLHHSGIEDAELVISTVPDELLKKTSNADIARMVRSMNERAMIITLATRLSDVHAQLAAGSTDVFVASVETARAIVPALQAVLAGELPGHVEARASIHDALRERKHVFD
jgi:Kef-type K+ transport system membrane component KefB